MSKPWEDYASPATAVSEPVQETKPWEDYAQTEQPASQPLEAEAPPAQLSEFHPTLYQRLERFAPKIFSREPGILPSTAQTTIGALPRVAKAAQESFLEKPLPVAEIKPDDSIPAAVGKEAYNLASGIPKFATSPVGFATAGAATIVPKTVAALFSADMFKNLGQGVLGTYKNWNEMTAGQKAAAITEMVGTGAFGTLLGAAALKKTKPVTTTEQPYASKIESTKPVPEHEIRTQVGTEAPLRQPDQGTAIPRTAERPSAETGKEGNAVVIPENKAVAPVVQPPQPISVPAEAVLEKAGETPISPAPTISVTPKTGKTQAPLEILNSAKQVKVTAPKSSTMVRVTDAKGKTATQSLASVQGENVFQGAGITKIEAGIIGKDKKFKLVKGEVTVEDKTPFPPGPGAMTVGEFEAQRPPEKPGEKIYGISQAARETRAAAGQVPAIEPGEGITGEEAVVRGRELLRQGYDAPAALARFEATGAVEPDAVMATRAYGENLAAKSRQAEKTFGTASNEFIEAYQALAEWDRATKPMATQLHRGFVAHQGKTDIDTGTYTGLARAFRDSTGKDFTSEQAVKAKQIAAEVSKADVAQEKALKKLYDTLQKETGVETRPAYKPTETDVKSTLEAIKKVFANQKAGQKFTTEQVRALWQYAKDVYVDKGNIDFPQLLTNLAVDTGLPRSEVARALAQPKAVRAITDEIYKKMSNRRRSVDQAKAWLKNQEVPGWLRFIKSIPRIFFINKIFGHGTVGMITHAGLNIFNPTAWKTYWPNFFKQFGYVFKPSYHERAMQDLMADPNFVLARRAGLVNDPFRYADDYQNAAMKTFMGKLGGLVGNRGFDALKTFRQARFNQIWDGLPQSLKTKDMASLIADSVNHATGVVKTSLPGPYQEAASITFFAPKLELSRWAWMIKDPVKASRIFKEWKNSTPEERAFAVSEFKQKAYIAGTYFGLLAMNQGLLSAIGSNQKINFTDPRRGDFLAFKIAGMNIGVTSPLMGMVRLFANLYRDAMGKRGQLQSLTPRGQQMAQDIGSYARGKLSPFSSTVYDVASQSDFQGRPLPWSSDKAPAYLRKRGLSTYTYGEWAAQQFAPIPVEEAIKEVWAAQGMNESEMEIYVRALMVGLIAGGTGARLGPDYYGEVPAAPPITPTVIPSVFNEP